MPRIDRGVLFMAARFRTVAGLGVLALAVVVPVGGEEPANAVAPDVLIGAGDIGTCGGDRDAATASLLDGVDGWVYTLGDNVYLDGSPAEFADCYAPAWGRHKARTRPTPGNHDYRTPDAAGYYGYFGAAAGTSPKGWYSYDTGGWHVIVLNSNGGYLNAEQLAWLRADLAANPEVCSVAMWHHPRYSSGAHALDASNPSVQPLLNVAYAGGVDIVLNGHDHWYERFAPMDPLGDADPSGIRAFTVGTGGTSLSTPDATIPVHPRSVVRNASTHGVLRLTLGAGNYTWQFLPTIAGANSDAGSGTCLAGGRDLPVAADRFDRAATTSGWGTAAVGGTWSQTHPTVMTVDGSVATARFDAAGTSRSARLGQVSATNVRLQATFGSDTPSTGGGQRSCIVARRVSSGNEYRIQVRRRADGKVVVSITRTLAGMVSIVTPETVAAGVLATAPIRTVAEIRGTNPTIIRAKVHNVGSAEPVPWLTSALDSTAELQVAGSVGWCGYVANNATQFPIRMSVDDFRADAITPLAAYDQFSRTVTGGWGSADVGGVWTTSAPGDFATTGNGATALIAAPAGARSARLESLVLGNAHIEGTLATDKAAAGGSQTSALVVRRVSTGNEYRFRLRSMADGTARLAITRILAGSETVLAEVVLVGVDPAAPIRVVGEIEGTRLRARAFNLTATEPTAWLVSATDSTPALQSPGAVGWAGYLALTTTNAPVTLTLDDFTAAAR